MGIEGVVLEILLSTHRSARARTPAEPALVRQAEAVIEQRSPAPGSLSEVADTLGVERTRLAHAFRRWRGRSVGEYIRLKRIEDARVLIGSTGLPLASVAARAGFADQSHLTRDLGAATGLTPAAYRALIRGRVVGRDASR